jgi:hypothetical protein
MYCGGTVVIRQAVQLVSGVNVSNLLELAKSAARAGNPKEAYDYYTKILEHEPRNAAAWVGKGEAVGWMSTVKDIKATEMVAAFNNAVNFASDSEKPALQRHCAGAINEVTSACYAICRKHVVQFAPVGNTYADYLHRCVLLISALKAGNSYDPANKTTIENVIHIASDNLKGMTYSVSLFFDRKFEVSPAYAAELRATIDEYAAKMCRLAPGFVKPRV